MRNIIVFLLGISFPLLAQAADPAWITCSQDVVADTGYSISLQKSGALFDYQFSENSYSGPRHLSSQKVSFAVSGSGGTCKAPSATSR